MTRELLDKETVVSSDVVPARDATGLSTLPGAGSRFLDEGELGRGGMSVVHRVRDASLLRLVAMKRLDPAFSSHPPEIERFVEEAQITGQLDHPNVVPVHELGVDDLGNPYFVMKLVRGKTYAEVLSSTPLPRVDDVLADLLGILLKICDAVAFAHSRGVVHRDLKPQNVMVGDYGEVYVMDWGLARVVPGRGRDPIAVRRTSGVRGGDDGSGTVWYMAPEQASPGWRPITELTDVFAIGALLYETLTGKPPHRGDSPLEVRRNAFACAVRHPDALLGEGIVPPALSRIALRAMAREPAERYPSVDELRRDLQRFFRGGEQFATRVFEPGEMVVREGDVGDAAYVITEGRCQVFKTIDGRKVVLREMGPGDVFGETAVFTEKPRTASIEALDRLVVREVRRDALEEGLGLSTWMGAFVRALAHRFREIDDKLTALESGRESKP